MPLLRWSVATWRKAEAVRDQVMRGTGTEEPWFMEHMMAEIGVRAMAIHYRKPLRIDEINLMANTPETRGRPGRA